MKNLGSIFALPEKTWEVTAEVLPGAAAEEELQEVEPLESALKFDSNIQGTDDKITGGAGATCVACGIGVDGAGFTSVAEQRAHFKTDWHRLNVKRRLSGLARLTEEQFQQLLEDEDEVGSISGSESSDSDEEADSSAVALHSPWAYFEAGGRRCAVWRAILTQPSSESVSSTAWVVPQLRSLRESGCRWLVVLSSGGHFAGAVVDLKLTPKARTLDEVLSVQAHKTFHRYVVRAKAGGRQSAKDGTGKYAKSAGSQLRRYNEAALEREVRDLLRSWKPLLQVASHMFVYAPAINSAHIFGGVDAPLQPNDPRLRKIPFPVRRPTFSEVKRVVHTLCHMYEVTQGDSGPADIPSASTLLSPPAISQTIVDTLTTEVAGGTPASSSSDAVAESDTQPGSLPVSGHTSSSHTTTDGITHQALHAGESVSARCAEGVVLPSHDGAPSSSAEPGPCEEDAVEAGGLQSHPIDVDDVEHKGKKKSKKSKGKKGTGSGKSSGSGTGGGGACIGGAGKAPAKAPVSRGVAKHDGVDDIDKALAEIAAMSVNEQQKKTRKSEGPSKPQPDAARRNLLAAAAERRMNALKQSSAQQQLW